MKKVRKGFTLVEMMIVIVIIGILAAMMMISSREATDSARVTKIVEGFRDVEAALMMFYADNTSISDRNISSDKGESDADIPLTGKLLSSAILTYMKDGGASIATNDAGKAGFYRVVTSTTPDGQWWIEYTLDGNKDNSRLAKRLASRAKELGYKDANTGTIKDYDGSKATIYMRVR